MPVDYTKLSPFTAHPMCSFGAFLAVLGARTLVLDMDGVLADFAEGALRLHGAGVSSARVTEYALHPLCGCTEAEFWENITNAGPGFWSGLPDYETTPWLLHFAKVGHRKAMIASSCGKGGRYTEHAIIGKTRWLRRHADASLPIYTGQNKTVLAGEHTLLLDDLPANVEAFLAAGGMALLVDRPWNQGHAHLPRIHLGPVFSEYGIGYATSRAPV